MFTKRTFGTLSAASFAASSSATFSSIGTSIGSRVDRRPPRAFHRRDRRELDGGASARRSRARESRGLLRVPSRTPSFVMVLVAANPHDPSTSARTPMPYDSESLTPVTWRSRVAMTWRR